MGLCGSSSKAYDEDSGTDIHGKAGAQSKDARGTAAKQEDAIPTPEELMRMEKAMFEQLRKDPALAERERLKKQAELQVAQDKVKHQSNTPLRNAADWGLHIHLSEPELRASEILRSGAVRMVDVNWLLQQPDTWRVHRCQDLPPEAFLSPAMAAFVYHKFFGVVVFSYGWQTKSHPDPSGFYFKQLKGYLKKHVEKKDKFLSSLERSFRKCREEDHLCSPAVFQRHLEDDIKCNEAEIQRFWNLVDKDNSGCIDFDEAVHALKGQRATVAPKGTAANGHTCVGLFWDFLSLPQPGPNGQRMQDEQKTFLEGLEAINYLYGAEWPTVVQLKQMPASVVADSEGNPNPYDSRGWCFFEEAVSGILKRNNRVLDISLLTQAQLEDMDWNAVADVAGASRRPPMPPKDMHVELQKRVFTNGTDCEKVAGIYDNFFTEIVPHVSSLYFAIFSDATGWGDDEMQQLAEALPYFSACETLNLHGHRSFGEAGLRALTQACKDMPNLRRVVLSTELQHVHATIGSDELEGLLWEWS